MTHDPLPTSIGPYAVVKELGRGAMGAVYLATAPSGEQVAVKVLLALDPEGILRFRREAELAARLQDPGILAPLVVGQQGHLHYYAMRHCTGESLEQRLRSRVPVSEAVRLVAYMGRTLQRAHDAGIVHRDLKPANVLLDREAPLLADFGLAKEVGAGNSLTVTGTILGTPAYMAPEQLLDSKRVGPPADVYALGVILYECLTGQVPHTGSTIVEICQRVLEGDPRDPRQLNPEVPDAVGAACLSALSLEPADRPSAAELAREIGGVWSTHHRRWPRVIAALLAATAVADGLFTVRSSAEPSSQERQDKPSASDDSVTDPLAELLAHAEQRRRALCPLPELRGLFERARKLAHSPAQQRTVDEAWIESLMARGQCAEVRRETFDLATEPSNRRLRYLRAKALRWEMSTSEAIQLLESLAAEDPSDPLCMLARSEASLWSGREQQAGLVDAALALAPDDPYVQVAQAYAVTNSTSNTERASRGLESGLEREPDHCMLLWAAAEVSQTAAKPHEALGYATRLIQAAEPTPPPRALARRGLLNLVVGRPSETLVDVDRVLAEAPHHAFARFLRALAFWRRGDEAAGHEQLGAFFLERPEAFDRTLNHGELDHQFIQVVTVGTFLALAFDADKPLSDETLAHLRTKTIELPGTLQDTAQRALELAAGGALWPEIKPHCEPLRASASGSVPASLLRVELLCGRDQVSDARDELADARALSSASGYAPELDFWESRVEQRGSQGRRREALARSVTRERQSRFGRLARLTLYQLADTPKPKTVDRLAESLAREVPDFTPGLVAHGILLFRRGKRWQGLHRLERARRLQGALNLDALAERVGAVAKLLFSVGESTRAREALARLLAVATTPRYVVDTLGFLTVINDSGADSHRWRLTQLEAALEHSADNGPLHALWGYSALVLDQPRNVVLSAWDQALDLSPGLNLSPAWLREFEDRFGVEASASSLKRFR